MSELINIQDDRTTIRWKLLASASALALTAYLSSANLAKAEDADRPLIWIDLGGQMENVRGQGEVFAPPFLSVYPTSSVVWKGVTPLEAEKPQTFSFGEDGKISFQPESSNWVFSASIRYGRSSNSREVDHQTSKIFFSSYVSGIPTPTKNPKNFEKFSDTQTRRQENHTILDFTAGRDVGVGMFGSGSSSTLVSASGLRNLRRARSSISGRGRISRSPTSHSPLALSICHIFTPITPPGRPSAASMAWVHPCHGVARRLLRATSRMANLNSIGASMRPCYSADKRRMCGIRKLRIM